jgi:hypothetical protein
VADALGEDAQGAAPAQDLPATFEAAQVLTAVSPLADVLPAVEGHDAKAGHQQAE